MAWETLFRSRMNNFETSIRKNKNQLPISIKIRVVSGCFHREHSPNAYKIIDEYLHSIPTKECMFEEHESGPEFLISLTIVSGAINFTANIIKLVTAIINARVEGIKRGDHPSSPLELIIRGYDKKGEYKEEKLLTISSFDEISPNSIKKAFIGSRIDHEKKVNVVKKKNKSTKKRPTRR
jgi:hypothetical protein